MSDLPVPGPPVRAMTGVRLLAPVSLFIAVYLAMFVAAGYVAAQFGTGGTYWIALASATVATFVSIRVIERGDWSIGFFVTPQLAAREWLYGAIFAAGLIGACDLLIVLSSDLRHVRAGGVAWTEILIIFIPAAVHEEIVFRGYVFQRLRSWSRPVAIAGTALVFSALHTGNEGVTILALVNLTLAGVLLALAYERYGRLWFPIGIHFAWNVLSGPVLGFGVSGYESAGTLLRTVTAAPDWATGGAFGIEASAWMMPVEMVAIAVLARKKRVASSE